MNKYNKTKLKSQQNFYHNHNKIPKIWEVKV